MCMYILMDSQNLDICKWLIDIITSNVSSLEHSLSRAFSVSLQGEVFTISDIRMFLLFTPNTSEDFQSHMKLRAFNIIFL